MGQSEYMEMINLMLPLMRGIQNITRLALSGFAINLLNLPFDNLAHLDLDYMGYFDGDELRGTGEEHLYRQYPNLKSLVFQNYESEMADENPDQPLPESFIRPESLIQILGCTNITSFRFEVQEDETIDFYDLNYSFDYIIEGLELAKDSLEEIQLDCVYHFSCEKLNQFGLATTFTHFSRLRKLYVIQSVLLPPGYAEKSDPIDLSAILPKTLESLTIVSPDEAIILWMRNLQQSLPYLSSLKKIILSCSNFLGLPASWFFDFTPVWAFQALESAGITVDIVQREPRCPWVDDDLSLPNFWVAPWSDGDWRSMVLGSDF